MCNLYSNTTAQQAMRQLYAVTAERDLLGNAMPQTAIWPKYSAPVVRLTPEGEREMVKMAWGFLTQKLSKKTGKPISPAAWNNARADKVMTNGLWRESFRMRRCLVPASSFREAKGRAPATDVWFALAGDEPRPAFAFAGMWRHAQPELKGSAADADTYTVITTTPNDLVREVHPDRMPVILAPEDYAAWLQGPVDVAAGLLRPYPAEAMRVVRRGIGILEDAPGI